MQSDKLTVTQAMKRLGLANRTIHNMIADGRLTAERINAPVPYYLITLESIQAYESSRENKVRGQSSH